MVILVIILIIIIIVLVNSNNTQRFSDREKLIIHVNDVMYNTIIYSKKDCPPTISQVDYLSIVIKECFLKFTDDAEDFSRRYNTPYNDCLAIFIAAYDRNVKLFNLDYVPF